MKRIKLIIPLLLSVICLSGCMPHTELDRQAITEAIGIDYEDGKYKVTVQYFNVEGSGGNSPIDPSKSNVMNISGTGDTVSTALESASVKCGRGFMYGITSIIIIGREALTQDITDTLSFAESYYQSNPGVLIAAADNKAEDILNIKFKEGIISVQKLEMLIKNAEYYGLGESIEIMELLSEQRRKDAGTALPLLTVVDSGSDATDDGNTAELIGGVLLVNGRYNGGLSFSDLSGLQILGEKPENNVISAEIDGKMVSVTIYDIRKKIRHEMTEGKLRFIIEIHANGKYTDSQLNSKSDYYGDTAEKLCAGIIEKRINSGLMNTVYAFGCDPCGLKYVISSDDYMQWIRLEDNFSEALRNAEFSVKCDIDIDRFGIAH